MLAVFLLAFAAAACRTNQADDQLHHQREQELFAAGLQQRHTWAENSGLDSTTAQTATLAYQVDR